MGYIDAKVDARDVRVGEEAEVDLFLSVREGRRSITGLILVHGNILTKEKVILRNVRLQPGRPLDGEDALNPNIETEPAQTTFKPYSDLPALHLAHDRAAIDANGFWY